MAIATFGWCGWERGSNDCCAFATKSGVWFRLARFFPRQSTTGLMPMTDRWLIATALAQFDRLHPAGSELKSAASNLAGASIEDVALADLVIELLRR